jgi:hypothetical protein
MMFHTTYIRIFTSLKVLPILEEVVKPKISFHNDNTNMYSGSLLFPTTSEND